MHKIEKPTVDGGAAKYRGCALIRLRSLSGRAQGWSTILRDGDGAAVRVVNETSKAKLLAAIDSYYDNN